MADDGNKNDKRPESQSELIDNNQKWWLKFVPNSEKWSDVNISRFLSIYKTHPLLWDPTHSFYKDQSKRMKTFSLIARRLNLRGIGEEECIKLLKSLKNLYTEEKKREIIARRCSSKYTSSPVWYPQIQEIVEIVQEKVANLIMKDSLSIEAESSKPWEVCCPRLYTEDIWTPKHFKTNIMDWFLTAEDEQLLCTCEKVSDGTNSDNICSTETSSTFYRVSMSDSSSENYQCPANREIHSTEMCCSNTQIFKSPDQSIKSVKNNGKMQRCNDRKLRKEEDASSICRNCSAEGITIIKKGENCSSANITEHDAEILSYCPCSELMSRKDENLHIKKVSTERTCCSGTDNDSEMSKTDKKCKTKKRRDNQKRKLVPCVEDSKIRLTVCQEEREVLDTCARKSIDEESRDEIEICCKKNSSLSRNRKLLEALLLQACGIKYDEESSGSSTSCDTEISCPCEHKESPIFLTTEITACKNRESSLSSKTESSGATKSLKTCLPTSAKISGSSSHSSSPLLECRSFSEKEESDHRLDFQPDPTLCEKCAVDRMPVRKTYRYKNIAHIEDPRMSDLDKYCRYKDWDAIYNIRTRVKDEEPIFLIDEDLLLMIRCKDEPIRLKRENYLPTKADINLFMDPNSSVGREVGLNNEYKRENGLNIQINQPKHNLCEVFETPNHQPAQLIL